MKAKIQTLLLALACLSGSANAASFSITPTAVSNTYSGQITLQVTGLTNGETVVIQKFLDANTNGVIDAGDILWQQFNLTDGQASVFHHGATAVTNFNVPGDTDTTAGQITAPLNFQNGDFSQNIVGKYLYKLSSPSGHFTPLTNFFNVTNFPYAQSFTGNVFSNNTATVVSNAVIILLQPSGNGSMKPQGGAVANNSGSYTIKAPPGTYLLAAFRSNYLANLATAPTLSLGSGSTITTNLTLTNATQSISGKIIDANNSSIGLAGLLMPVSTQNGLLGICFTDTNGNFTTRVNANQWKIGGDSGGLAVHGYVGLQNSVQVDTTAGSVSGVTIALPKATAIFYGSVKDNLGNPLAGIDVYANDNNNQYQSDGYTDANGNYIAGASAADWQVNVSSDSSPANYLFSQGFDTTLSVGQAVLWNFIAILATNHITGHVQFNGNPVSGVQVYAYANINGVDYQSQVDTDSSGNYSLNVGNGNWSVGVHCNGSDNSLDNILGNGTYQCPDQPQVNISNGNGTANFTIQPCSGVQITTTSPLPDGQVGDYYDTQLQASSCNNNFTWSLNDPADFPSSLTLEPWGEIDGTPDTGGTNNFSVHVDDNNGHSTNQSFSLYIAGVSSPLQVTTTYLPDGTVNAFYSQTLQASGGQPPYSWSIPAYSADPPPNLTLATNGVLSGTLTDSGTFYSGTFYFTVEVVDSLGGIYDQTLSLYIAPAPPVQVTTTNLPSGTSGGFYSQQLQAAGGTPFGGASPYRWSLSPGSASLPPNLTLATNGVLSGIPTNKGTYSFSVRATDSVEATADQPLSLVVSGLQVTTTYLPYGTNGVAYSQQLQAAGGTPFGGASPYSWSLSPGSTNLPSSLTLATNGVISGTPSAKGTYAFSVRATDSAGATADQLLSLIVGTPTSSSLFTCTTNNGVITITGYNGGTGAVLIPVAINGWPVTGIGTNAFANDRLTSVTIPGSVTNIADQAFYNCYNLTNVTLCNGVTTIGDFAFENCSVLPGITIPGTVTSIGQYAFYGCNGLASVTIANGVTSIGEEAFYQCYYLTNVTIGNSVTSIGDYAFYNCGLTSVTIPNSVTTIGSYAFYYCYSLNNVTIGNGVTGIGSFAFYYCYNLTSVTIPGSVASIGSYAFGNCTSVTNVAIANGVPCTIGSYAFYDCTSLTSVTIGNGVTSIGANAFYYCYNLIRVSVGNGVANIGSYAFQSCTSLMSVFFYGNPPAADSSVFLYDDNVTVYYLPSATGWTDFFATYPAVLWNPQVQTGDASFGVRTNQFGFNITGASGLTLVVEACTNLGNPIWLPVGTNTFTGDSSYFGDPRWTNYPGRFYRLRSP
jgi:hypothetical protein